MKSIFRLLILVWCALIVNFWQNGHCHGAHLPTTNKSEMIGGDGGGDTAAGMDDGILVNETRASLAAKTNQTLPDGHRKPRKYNAFGAVQGVSFTRGSFKSE